MSRQQYLVWTQVSRQQYLVSCTNTYLCPTLVEKQSMFFMSLLSSMALVSLTPNRVSISALQSQLPPLRASSCGCSSSRNPRPVLHQDLSSMVTRRATSCASTSKTLTVCLLGIVLGESSVFQHRAEERAVGGTDNINFKNTW